MTTFDKILAGGIITIIRGLDSDHAEKTVEAIFAGGLRLAEITFVQTAAPEVTANIIRTLNRKLGAGPHRRRHRHDRRAAPCSV